MIKRFAFLIIILANIKVNLTYAGSSSTKFVMSKNIESYAIKFETDLRWNDSDISHRHYDLGLKGIINHDLSYQLNIRKLYKYDDKKNKWQKETRPHLNLKKRIELKSFNILIRDRYEFRYKSGRKMSQRNRLKLIMKLKDNHKLIPFIGSEVFYNISDNIFSKYWFIVGLDIAKFYEVKTKIYYKYILRSNNNYDNDVTLKLMYEF
tara:strand:- start:2872 stop:3492 length:621 start_codon:yes stop_codon:yes gene_type:complete